MAWLTWTAWPGCEIQDPRADPAPTGPGAGGESWAGSSWGGVSCWGHLLGPGPFWSWLAPSKLAGRSLVASPSHWEVPRVPQALGGEHRGGQAGHRGRGQDRVSLQAVRQG